MSQGRLVQLAGQIVMNAQQNLRHRLLVDGTEIEIEQLQQLWLQAQLAVAIGLQDHAVASALQGHGQCTGGRQLSGGLLAELLIEAAHLHGLGALADWAGCGGCMVGKKVAGRGGQHSQADAGDGQWAEAEGHYVSPVAQKRAAGRPPAGRRRRAWAVYRLRLFRRLAWFWNRVLGLVSNSETAPKIWLVTSRWFMK